MSETKNKKLLVLGGSGDMGSYAVRQSIKFSVYSQITIGDIDEKNSKKIIKKLKDDRLRFQKVNAFKKNQLLEVIKRHDIVISCIGPFYIFGPLVARACLDARVPLVDICDDYGPTLEIMKMDEEAKKANVKLMVGYGWTPGLSNICAKYGYDKLDKNHPIKINIAWGGGAKDSEGLAVVMHVLYACDGKVPSFLKNKQRNIEAVSGFQIIEFPKPLKNVTVFHCGHPEPVTIPKYLKGVSECTLRGGLTPDWNNGFSAALRSFGLLKGKWLKRNVAKVLHKIEGLLEKGGVCASSARVDMYGKMNGKDVHLIYCTPSVPMGELTGYPAALTAKMCLEGKIKGFGVIPPETQDAKLFLRELEEIGIKMVYDDEGEPKIMKKPKNYKEPLIFGVKQGFQFLFSLIIFLFLFILYKITTIFI